MHLAPLLFGLFVLLPAVPAAAAATTVPRPANDEVKVLYQKWPWSVFLGSTVPRRDAQALIADQLFDPCAMMDFAIINVEAKDWSFTPHAAMLHLVADSGPGFGGTAVYARNFVQIRTTPKALPLMLEMLGKDVAMLEVKDDKLHVLATFPVMGMADALEVWKTCVAGR